MKNLWAPWRMAYILGEDEQAKTNGCIFCVDQEFSGADKSRLILATTGLSLVMMNRYPYNNGHLLVAPRRHTGELAGLNAEEKADLIMLVDRATAALKKDMNPDGFNVGLNLGQAAGAGVAEHLHFHIVPRWKGDVNFMTVLDDVRVVPEHLLATFERLLNLF